MGVQVSREPPPPLPGGYTVGEQVYFTGHSQTVENGDGLEHGKRGEVAGPAICERLKGKGVAVLFPGNKGVINVIDVCRRRHQAPLTAPRRPSCPLPPSPPHYYVMWCVGAQVSREPPPPLLGGYTVGEQVYYTGASHTINNGDQLEHGKQGEVVGPATTESHKGKGVTVRFAGNKRVNSCYLTGVCRHAPAYCPHTTICACACTGACACRYRCTCDMGVQVSREPPPPLPGGYTVGQQVYFTGSSKAFESGSRLEHGKQGEVVGPATSESHKGKGVAVSFPGNKRGVECYLSQARCRRRRAATRRFPPHLPAHPRYVARGRTGELQAATAAAGRLRGW